MCRASIILMSCLYLIACGGGGSGGSDNGSSSNPPILTTTNNAPTVVNPNSDQTALTGVAFSYDATQNGMTFNDQDGDALSYATSFSDTNTTLTANNGVISGTLSAVGSMTITVTATDGNGGEVSDEFVLTITEPQASSEPNILLIISDDQGQDSSAQYSLSTDLPNTPVLNNLASAGLVFENVWVNPACSPTRAGLISGKYAIRTGVISVGNTLPATETPIHAFLENDPVASIYSTALIGKWHLGGGLSGPNDRGINHFAGITSGGVNDYYDWTLNVNGTNANKTSYVTTELTNQAIDWIGTQTSPWFVWLAYNAPHTPFHLPPNELHSQNLTGSQADIDANERAYYLAAIEAMDTEIGRLLESLSAEERANTIILYVGDNGTPNQVRDQSVYPNGAKGSLTEGGVKVPMFVTGAGVTRIGERENALINNTDFYATIADLAGSATTEIDDSKSFKALLTSSAVVGRETIYSEYLSNNVEGWTIRNDQYKLTVMNETTEMLYDVNNDPMENTDLLSGSADLSAVRDELKTAGDAIRQ